MNCTRCEGTGFLNLDQVPGVVLDDAGESDFHAAILKWIADNEEHDVQVCDCCGDGEGWYGEPGEHDHRDQGHDGPYAYNGGLWRCW